MAVFVLPCIFGYYSHRSRKLARNLTIGQYFPIVAFQNSEKLNLKLYSNSSYWKVKFPNVSWRFLKDPESSRKDPKVHTNNNFWFLVFLSTVFFFRILYFLHFLNCFFLILSTIFVFFYQLYFSHSLNCIFGMAWGVNWGAGVGDDWGPISELEILHLAAAPALLRYVETEKYGLQNQGNTCFKSEKYIWR